MSKRSYLRIPVRIAVNYSRDKINYSGTITNLSEDGMFLKTSRTDFPPGSEFEITIPAKKTDLRVSAKLIRSAKIDSSDGGIGLHILNTSKTYIDFVENLLYIL